MKVVLKVRQLVVLSKLICLIVYGYLVQGVRDFRDLKSGVFFIRNQDPRGRGTIAYEYVPEQVLGDQDAVLKMQPQSPASTLIWSLDICQIL